MDKKGLLISADIDTTEVEKKLSEFQSKINNMRLSGPGGVMSQVGGNYSAGGQNDRAERIEKMRQKFNQDNRNKLAKDLKEQEKLLEKHENMYEKMSKHVKSLAEGTDEHTAAIKRKDKAEQDYLRTLDKVSKIQQTLGEGSSIADVFRGKGRGPFSGYEMARMKAGFGMGMGRGMREVGKAGKNAFMKNPFGNIAALLGVAGTAAQFYGRSQLQIGTLEERTAAGEADIAGVLSESARLQSQRRGYEMEYYGPERARAMEASRNRMEKERTKDSSDLLGTGLKIAGSALAFASIPFTAGLSTPLAIAAGTGLGLSGISEAMGYATNDRKYSMLFDEKAYDTLIGQKGAKTYNEQLQIQKQRDPMKMMAQKFFEENRQRMLQTQRAFGLSDEELFKGENSIYSRAANAGLSGDIVEQQMRAMQSAGGTTAASRQGGVFAAQMARGLDLTNAASLMGKISGRTGGTGAESRDEVIRMYAEATKLGLNESEVRDLLETSTQIALQTGASGNEIQALLQSGIGTQSRRGIEAAQNALSDIKNRSGDVGNQKRLQFALAEYGSEDFSKFIKGMGGNLKDFGIGDMAELAGFDVTEIGKGNESLMNKLAQMGLFAEDLSDDQLKQIFSRLKKINLESSFSNIGTSQGYEEIGDLEEQIAKETNPEKKKQLQRDLMAARGKQGGRLTTERLSGYTDQKSKEQQAIMGIEGEIVREQVGAGGATQEDIAAAAREAKSKDTGRTVDKYIEGEARSFANQVKIMNKKLGALTTAFEKAAKSEAWEALDGLASNLISQGKLTEEGLTAMREAISNLRNEGSNKIMNEMFNTLTNPQPKRQNYVSQGAPTEE